MAGRAHGMEDRERTALALLAAGMFAEAHELPPGSALAACLNSYLTQFLRPRAPDGGREPYELESRGDIPVFRRLATLMDALALALGPWSAVGRALSSWSERVALAVAEAERGSVTLHGPAGELVAMAAALRAGDADSAVGKWLLARRPDPAAPAGPRERDRPTPPARTGRIWSRPGDHGGRRSRRSRG